MFFQDKIESNSFSIHFLTYSQFKFEEYLSILNENELERLNNFSNPKRKMEFVSTRILKEKILPGTTIQYNSLGVPFINENFFISISHTKGCSAIAVSKTQKIGLDVEFISKKAKLVHSKFLNDEEKVILNTEDSKIMTLAWTCKEALYKLSNQKKLDFKRDLQIVSFDGVDTFNCRLIINNHFHKVTMKSIIKNEFVFTINEDVPFKLED